MAQEVASRDRLIRLATIGLYVALLPLLAGMLWVVGGWLPGYAWLIGRFEFAFVGVLIVLIPLALIGDRVWFWDDRLVDATLSLGIAALVLFPGFVWLGGWRTPVYLAAIATHVFVWWDRRENTFVRVLVSLAVMLQFGMPFEVLGFAPGLATVPLGIVMLVLTARDAGGGWTWEAVFWIIPVLVVFAGSLLVFAFSSDTLLGPIIAMAVTAWIGYKVDQPFLVWPAVLLGGAVGLLEIALRVLG